MPVTITDVNRLRRAQSEVVRLAQGELQKLWFELSDLPPERLRDALLDLLPALIGRYSEVGGTAAVEWYERVRAYYFSDDFDGRIYSGDRELTEADRLEEEDLRRLIRWKAGVLWDSPDSKANPGELYEWLDNMLDSRIRDTARDTIRGNARHDPRRPRYARVSNPGCCAFCALMSSRGYVYGSEDSASFANSRSFHRNPKTGKETCRCEIVPEFRKGDNRIEGYDPARLERLYRDAYDRIADGKLPDDWLEDMKAKGISTERPTDPNTITYVMRRMHPDEYGDGVTR